MREDENLVLANLASIIILQPDPQQLSPIDSFPASDQPISEQTMKSMLISLRKSLHSDLSATVSSQANIVQQQDVRINHIESKMSDLFNAHNDMEDVYTEQEDKLQSIKLKLADLEDRSHRNNIKFRNIPESIEQSDLMRHVQSLIHTLVWDLSERDLEIDGAHRLSKPSHLPESKPRDVLARIHFFLLQNRR